MTFSACS